MDFIAFIVFIILQIIFIPLAIIGLILLTVKQVLVSKKLGVSSTATSVIGNRWYMNTFGIRKDPVTIKLYRVIPNGSALGLWLVYFPSYLRYKISGKNRGFSSIKEEGMESVGSVAITRTIHFDNLISKLKDNVEQFVVMGAGYDTRCYGELKGSALKFFELDQQSTQKLKVDCLKKAGIETSHVTFVSVDFTAENWYEKLKNAGYDQNKKSLFLWEGVTPYLKEDDVRKTLKEIKALAAPGSILLADFYAARLLALKGVKATDEGFKFGLDFTAEEEKVLKEFFKSANLKLGEFHFMGQKTKKGAFGVVAEISI